MITGCDTEAVSECESIKRMTVLICSLVGEDKAMMPSLMAQYNRKCSFLLDVMDWCLSSRRPLAYQDIIQIV